MIINGSLKSNKTELLINEYISLINKGISQEQILFITLNAYKKNKVKKHIKAFLPNHAPNIQTFSGICYSHILNNSSLFLQIWYKKSCSFSIIRNKWDIFFLITHTLCKFISTRNEHCRKHDILSYFHGLIYSISFWCFALLVWNANRPDTTL